MKKFKDNIKLVDNIPDWPGYHVTPEGVKYGVDIKWSDILLF